MPSTTYKLDWNVLKEGSVIKFNGESTLFGFILHSLS